ncbi:MAG: hypothetical protein MHMPM18_004944 [Marteilia pararefringens]
MTSIPDAQDFVLKKLDFEKSTRRINSTIKDYEVQIKKASEERRALKSTMERSEIEYREILNHKTELLRKAGKFISLILEHTGKKVAFLHHTQTAAVHQKYS